MKSWSLIQDIVILLATALVLGLLFRRLRQSAIVGCLVAGTLVGPSVLKWVPAAGVEHVGTLHDIAELGVAMLLFTIGLEVSWRRFRSFGLIAIGGGSLQVALTGALTTLAAALFGADWPAAIAIGALVSLSSTATVLRILQDRAEMDSVHGRASLGILLMQDILVVPLVLLVTFLGKASDPGSILGELGRTTGRAALLVAGVLIAANLFVPRLFNLTALTRDRELPVIVAVVTWLGATWAAHALNLSVALGAFVAGMILAGSPFATQIRADVAPFRIVFVTFFFASLGLLARLDWLFQPAHFVAVILVSAAIIALKAAVIWFVLRVLRRPNAPALATGIALANIGEFSFVLAAIALGNDVLDADTFQLIVSATLVTLIATPPLVAHASPLSLAIERFLVRIRIWRPSLADLAQRSEPLQGHVIIVGYGPSGQAVAAALHVGGFEVVVIDLNPKLLARAMADDHPAALADATRRDTLEHLNVQAARAVVVTVPDHRSAEMVIEQARSLAPQLKIVARGRYHAYAEQLRRAGATVCVDEEIAVGKLLGEAAVAAARDEVVED